MALAQGHVFAECMPARPSPRAAGSHRQSGSPRSKVTSNDFGEIAASAARTAVQHSERRRGQSRPMPRGTVYLPNDRDRTRLADGLAFSVPVERIAEVMGVAERTLRRRYADVFKAAALKDGPKPLEPTEEQRMIVAMAAAIGTPHEDIGKLIGISETTLRRYFRRELDLGATRASLQVGGNLFKMATGDPSLMTTLLAAIWWSKSRMGWKDLSRIRGINTAGASVENAGHVIVVLPENSRGDVSVAPGS
jgi:hypothetical protein